jgi:hypothetical protein
MQLTKLRAAPVRQAEVPPCAPAGGMDGGTASQLIRSVRRLLEGRWRLRLILAWACVLLPLTVVTGTAGATHLRLDISDEHGMTASWSIHVAPSGEVTRDGDSPVGPQQLSVEARARLNALVSHERFFALNRAYGVPIVEGHWRTITATLDGKRHTVLLYDLPAQGDPGPGVRAALRTWYGILREVAGGVPVETNDARIIGEKPR